MYDCLFIIYESCVAGKGKVATKYEKSTSVLEVYVYDCEENTLDVCLRINAEKHQLTADERGWLVLNYEREEIGSFIAG